MITETKLVGWVRVIVWNTFKMSTDISFELSEWDRRQVPVGLDHLDPQETDL